MWHLCKRNGLISHIWRNARANLDQQTANLQFPTNEWIASFFIRMPEKSSVSRIVSCVECWLWIAITIVIRTWIYTSIMKITFKRVNKILFRARPNLLWDVNLIVGHRNTPCVVHSLVYIFIDKVTYLYSSKYILNAVPTKARVSFSVRFYRYLYAIQ